MPDRSKPRRTHRDCPSRHKNVVGLFSKSPLPDFHHHDDECEEQASGLVWSVVLAIIALVWAICIVFAWATDSWWPALAAAAVTYIMIWRA